MYGIITEATIKIFSAPKCRRYGSVLFPDYSLGISFFREVARQVLSWGLVITQPRLLALIYCVSVAHALPSGWWITSNS